MTSVSNEVRPLPYPPKKPNAFSVCDIFLTEDAPTRCNNLKMTSYMLKS